MQNRVSEAHMTWMLCAVCILVTVANSTSSVSGTDLWSHIGHCTDATPEDIWNGHYYLLITSVFLHANFTQGFGIAHLAFNMIWLFRMGSVLEISIGTVYYFLFWVAAAAVSSCAELAVTGSTGIGASGVVYAIFGMLWAGRGRYPEWGQWANASNIRLFLGWGIFCLVMTDLHIMQVANWAHAGGLAFGYCVGAALLIPRQRWIAVGSLVALLTMSAFSLTYMPWSANWTFWKGNKEFTAQNYTQAVSWYKKSLKLGVDPSAAWENIGSAWNNKAILDSQKGDLNASTTDFQQEGLANGHIGQGLKP